MSKDLTVFCKFKFRPYETISELARVDAKRADVTSNLLALTRDPFAKNNFKDSLTLLSWFTEDEGNEMGGKCER